MPVNQSMDKGHVQTKKNSPCQRLGSATRSRDNKKKNIKDCLLYLFLFPKLYSQQDKRTVR